MILTHVRKIEAMSMRGSDVSQIGAALRGMYTEDQIRVFMPAEEPVELTPAEKGKATKAANKAKAEAAASPFE